MWQVLGNNSHSAPPLPAAESRHNVLLAATAAITRWVTAWERGQRSESTRYSCRRHRSIKVELRPLLGPGGGTRPPCGLVRRSASLAKRQRDGRLRGTMALRSQHVLEAAPPASTKSDPRKTWDWSSICWQVYRVFLRGSLQRCFIESLASRSSVVTCVEAPLVLTPGQPGEGTCHEASYWSCHLVNRRSNHPAQNK